MTLINRTQKHSDKMVGRQRVVAVDVDIGSSIRPWVTVHREDEHGNGWNYSFVGWQYLGRGRQMQDIIIANLEASNDE